MFSGTIKETQPFRFEIETSIPEMRGKGQRANVEQFRATRAISVLNVGHNLLELKGEARGRQAVNLRCHPEENGGHGGEDHALRVTGTARRCQAAPWWRRRLQKRVRKPRVLEEAYFGSGKDLKETGNEGREGGRKGGREKERKERNREIV